jgi:hypothetical protein
MFAVPPSPPPRLVLLPGRLLVLLLLRLDDGQRAVIAEPPAHLLHALRAAAAVLGFGALHRAEPTPEELLPWAGNV